MHHSICSQPSLRFRFEAQLIPPAVLLAESPITNLPYSVYLKSQAKNCHPLAHDWLFS
jgi:hypothetical protein